ncbi:hypothetical protein COT72_02130 [archaeon CG10_big_fil_rev_8_21_14_0_10_43_11]|nr:MAG: hypothetical protein COT72_02130 [archaeon CG10_big_fil_rev_8_21_14_0_10_43_11]
MNTIENVLKDELIGLHVEVVASKNKDQIGLKGRVVDETKNMLVIAQNSTEKKVYKAQTSFKFTLKDGQNVLVDGILLLARPEERIKKTIRKTRW